MKTREQKQKDLNALTEQLSNSKSAMVISFNRVTVNKDQELREQLRSAGANYKVVKNTIARLAVAGTPYAGADEHFKGVSAIAWTDTDPVILSKTVSKFVKANGETFSFKVGVVDGRVVTLQQVEAIASLPSKEELISKLLFVINAQAQRIVTVINAVPRNLAVVIKLIGDAKPATAEKPAEPKAVQPAVEASAATEEATTETAAQATEQVTAQEEPAATEE
ncbi:MAG TPA: 50S ribosomal protein L10 [Pyrinomonadaceae bacterium]|nr:50S ribosomal protein L10 [Pyrinomonadaceae bacterium]